MKVLVTLMQHTKQKKTFLTAIPTLSIGRAFSCCSKLLFLIWIWTIIFLFYFNCSIPSKYLEFYIISSLEYYLIEFRFARLRYVKVHIFWDGHKFLWNLHRRFVLCSNCQIYGGDFADFCGLLRIYELYYRFVIFRKSLLWKHLTNFSIMAHCHTVACRNLVQILW